MATQVKCPSCGQRTAWHGNPYRPFCCERCRLRDFGNWMSERYRIAGPGVEIEPADGDDEDDT